MSESREFGWFRAIDAPFGPTWWSSRHGTFVRLFRGIDATHPPPFGLGEPGPRELAWSTTRDWVACEHVVGPTLAELLLQVPHQALHGDLLRSIVGRALSFSFRFTHDGWFFPQTSEIRLGFDGSVSVEVKVGRGLPARGSPDGPVRDAYHDARDAAVDGFLQRAGALAHALGLTLRTDRELEAWAALDVPLALLLADEFADAHAAWSACRNEARAHPPLTDPPPGTWNDVIERAEEAGRARQRRRLEFGAHHARSLFDRLAEAEREFSSSDHSDVDPERDAEDAIARFHLMREKPLSTWTWRELAEWKGVRRQRLREVLRARGPGPESLSVRSSDAAAEQYVLEGRTDLRRLQLFHGDADPRIEHVMRRGTAAGWKSAVPADILAREREELAVRGLFGMEAWCASTFDDASIEDVRSAWRGRWLAIDDELGPDGIARCTQLSPHFGPTSSEAKRRAAELMAEEARPPPPPPADTSRTVPAETPVCAFHGALDDDTPDGEPRLEVEVAVRVDATTWAASTAWFRGDVEIGRVATNQVELPELLVNRQHATLRMRDGAIIVVDRRSVRGTFLDGRRLSAPQRVVPANKLFIGRFRIRARQVTSSTCSPWP